MEKLISESQMDEMEKQMFTEMLPYMTDAQKDWLRLNIETENAKLAELERKYGKVMTDEEKVKFRESCIAYLTS